MAIVSLPGWPHTGSPYHAGERAVQERIGVRDKMESVGRKVIRDFMPEQHRELFTKLPFMLAGTVDHEGQPWASLLAGAPGFVASPDEKTLRINATPLAGDSLQANLKEGAAIGLLGIELPTRRRNRMNGIVSSVDERGFTITVKQSFGNCAKYIQSRECLFNRETTGLPIVEQRSELLREDCELIRASDTFFIASASLDDSSGNASGGVDVSHRGGLPGFVHIEEGGVLIVPDFKGNFFFNTLGNLSAHPVAGLLFIDFKCGALLYLACGAEMVWEGTEVKKVPGAQRLIRFKVNRVIRTARTHRLRWSGPEYSPVLQQTGFLPAKT
jgi:predicted pyridoxine 5'-phosphate oxidase superfamily flavin-nucleotide-binding protein